MSKEYPLYPELNADGNKEAQALIDKFKSDAKKILNQLLDDYLGNVYVDLLPEIESDSWSNYRNALMDGFRNYDNRLIQNRFDFKEIRQAIFKQFKEEIIKDLDQDNLDKIKNLQDQVNSLQETIRKINYYNQ